MTTLLLPGFTNQLRRESASWWSTRRWWVQAGIWTVLTNGLLAMMLWVVPQLEAVAQATPAGLTDAAVQFTGMAGLLASVAVVVVTQGALIDERRLGLLEWILSKPLSRPALLSSKFVGQGAALLVTVVLVPWAVAYGLLSAADGSPWPVARWLAAVMMVALLAVFHLSLVLALSALTWSRALVVAVPLAGIIGTDLVVAAAPRLVEVLPWNIGRLAGPVLTDGSLATVGPLASAAVLTVVCLAAAGWALGRTEL